MTMVQPAPDEGEWFAEVPRSVRRHTIWGLVLLVLSFGGFGAWAMRARRR